MAKDTQEVVVMDIDKRHLGGGDGYWPVANRRWWWWKLARGT
jgi:hypothetical protein